MAESGAVPCSMNGEENRLPLSHSPIKRVCVYCGSKPGNDNIYVQAAQELGKEIAARRMGLVYGGGSGGLMGAVAQASIDAGGYVLGIIPAALVPREVSGSSIGEVRIVSDMHERKAQMAAEAQAFIALPGGYGTLEELLEMITWSQLGIHSKPVGVLNINGFYSPLLQFFDKAVERGFVTSEARKIVLCGETPKELLDLLEAYSPTHNPVASSESWKVSSLGYSKNALQH